jgi:hypothetical protein
MSITNKQIHDELKDLKLDVRYIKKKLLDPDDGTIARVNKNTEFRATTGKVLWSVWIVLLGIIGKLTFWN